jgi:hypothetical protein
MATPYFQNMPSIYYTFDPNLINFDQVKNIFTRVKMLDSIINNIDVYYTYQVKDSDTPQNIAYKYYGSAERYWIILFTNQIIDPYYQWPLNLDVFNQTIINNFGDQTQAMTQLDHIEKQTTVTSVNNGISNQQTYTILIDPQVINFDGIPSTAFPTISNPVVQIGANTVVTFPDGTVTTTSVRYVAVSSYDQFLADNEALRTIKLVKKDYVDQIETELKSLFNQY